jgi:uncharacterized RmlC-like cupin family protein
MRERQFVLGPERVRVTVLTTGAETGGRHDSHRQLAAAGSMTPLHLHTRYEERIWVASGSLTIWSGPDKVVLRSGDYHLIPTRVPHTSSRGPRTPTPSTSAPRPGSPSWSPGRAPRPSS